MLFHNTLEACKIFYNTIIEEHLTSRSTCGLLTQSKISIKLALLPFYYQIILLALSKVLNIFLFQLIHSVNPYRNEQHFLQAKTITSLFQANNAYLMRIY
jgi:hypothetical protein